jgi:hemerythrin
MATLTAPFVVWNESWLIGVQEVDAQHKQLVSLVNQLHQAMSQGKGKEVLGGILDSLILYTQQHFSAEERMLEQNQYPDLLEHKRQHVALTKKVVDFQQEFKGGTMGMSLDIMQFLKTWLQSHILGTDVKYVPLLHSKGIR